MHRLKRNLSPKGHIVGPLEGAPRPALPLVGPVGGTPTGARRSRLVLRTAGRSPAPSGLPGAPKAKGKGIVHPTGPDPRTHPAAERPRRGRLSTHPWTPMLTCLLHNIGHHDLYLLREEESEEAPYRPPGSACRELGEALAQVDLDAAELCFNGAGLRLPATLSWGPGEGYRCIYMPLLAAALEEIEQRISRKKANHPQQSLKLTLVTAGKEKEGNNPQGFTPALLRLAKLRSQKNNFAGIELIADPRHLHGDAYALDPGGLYREIQRPLEHEAQKLAKQHGEAWQSYIQVCLSASTGTAAMIAGLSAALSRWRPDVLTVSNARQAPNRDRHGRLSTPKARATPMRDLGDSIPLPVENPGTVAEYAIQELGAWHKVYRAARPKPPSKGGGEADFWFRKGLKEVLAVVITRDANNHLRAHRGVNLEVSLPTGSLCAERNAMGSAFVAQPDLQRADIAAVAILSLDPSLPRLGPCGACQEWLRKIAEVNPELQILTFENDTLSPAYLRPLGPA
jgi:cytidine deaminase